MNNSTSKWPEIIYRAFLGFVIAAVISPLVAHIPPHIKWLSFLVGLAAAISLGIYNIMKTVKASKNDGSVIRRNLPSLLYYIIGGTLGGFVGALAAHFI